MDRLEGRVAVVTGGASGIGRALVLELADAGMTTVVADIEADKAAAVADDAAARGVPSHAVTVDVADAGSVQHLADETFDRFGAVHVLCNNAGVLVFRDCGEASAADWQWVYGVNVMGVAHGISAFLPRMLEQSDPAHIVNTSSIAALNAEGVYGTSKAAILSISDALADELAETEVGVSVLLPGMVSTQIIAAERNRPAELDGPDRPPDPAGAWGLDPSTCAVRVHEALLSGERYVFAGIPEGQFDLETRPRRRFDALLDAVGRGIVPDAEAEA